MNDVDKRAVHGAWAIADCTKPGGNVAARACDQPPATTTRKITSIRIESPHLERQTGIVFGEARRGCACVDHVVDLRSLKALLKLVIVGEPV